MHSRGFVSWVKGLLIASPIVCSILGPIRKLGFFFVFFLTQEVHTLKAASTETMEDINVTTIDHPEEVEVTITFPLDIMQLIDISAKGFCLTHLIGSFKLLGKGYFSFGLESAEQAQRVLLRSLYNSRIGSYICGTGRGGFPLPLLAQDRCTFRSFSPVFWMRSTHARWQ